MEFIKLDKLGKEKREGEFSWVPGGRACRVSPAQLQVADRDVLVGWDNS